MKQFPIWFLFIITTIKVNSTNWNTTKTQLYPDRNVVNTFSICILWTNNNNIHYLKHLKFDSMKSGFREHLMVQWSISINEVDLSDHATKQLFKYWRKKDWFRGWGRGDVCEWFIKRPSNTFVVSRTLRWKTPQGCHVH